MKVLVTGGNGFIGSHVVEALAGAGVEVRVVDRNPMWPGADAPPDGVEWLAGDLREAVTCAAAVDGVDAVCHQAAKVGLGVDFADAPGYVDDNDVGTVRLLAALWASSFRGRLVLAGSMVVYGEGRYRCGEHGDVAVGRRRPADLDAGAFEPRCPVAGCHRFVAWAPVAEQARLDPRSTYAATKLHTEHLCSVWASEAGAEAVALRYHNVYGPRLPRDTPYAGVAALFIDAVAGGRAPEVYEDGGQMRDFVHVRDVARANVSALLTPDVEPGAYNIASGVPHTVGDLARAVCAALGNDLAPRVSGRWRAGDVRHIVASPDRAARGLSFVAEVGFEDGVAELARAGAARLSPR